MNQITAGQKTKAKHTSEIKKSDKIEQSNNSEQQCVLKQQSILELPDNLKQNGEIHEISHTNTSGLEMISEEHFKMLCNPSAQAFQAALEDFLCETKIQKKKEIIGQMHTILLIDGAQYNQKIQENIVKIFPCIENPELYQDICILLSDVSHFNTPIQKSLISFGIFDKLDFSKNISFSVVLSLCDDDEANWKIFKDRFLTEEMKNNSILKILLEKYKN